MIGVRWKPHWRSPQDHERLRETPTYNSQCTASYLNYNYGYHVLPGPRKLGHGYVYLVGLLSQMAIGEGVRSEMHYRPDIDGLRAIAVLAVLFFHCGIPGVTGGYVGVDVFFVISGYVIASTLLRDLEAGRFSIRSFYERRVRRIFPPLIFTFVVCWALAWWLLLPSDFLDFSRSLLSSAASFSNMYFWKYSGYFENGAELRPLLHTWSLSVEEQFYLIAPAAMWVCYRFLGARFPPPVHSGRAPVARTEHLRDEHCADCKLLPFADKSVGAFGRRGPGAERCKHCAGGSAVHAGSGRGSRGNADCIRSLRIYEVYAISRRQRRSRHASAPHLSSSAALRARRRRSTARFHGVRWSA